MMITQRLRKILVDILSVADKSYTNFLIAVINISYNSIVSYA